METTMRNPSLLCLSIACAMAPAAHAQQRDATELDEVVVTATRTAQPARDALAPVEVIDRAGIERSGARSLPELLRGRAGISLVNQGGLGKVSTLFVRGGESDHVLLLVDGVRVASATSGLPALQDLPLELIERIEIVRGPRSALYGSEAIGAVVQVFTRRQQGDAPVQPRGRIGAGSNGLRELAAGAGLRAGIARMSVDLSHQSGSGIDACRGAATPVFAGCGMDHPDRDRDGFENTSASVQLALEPGPRWSARAHALRSLGRNQFDGDADWGLPDNSSTVQQVLGGSLRWAASDAVVVSLTAGSNHDASDNFIAGTQVSTFASTRRSATLQADATMAQGHLLTLGLDWLHDSAAVREAFAGLDAVRANRALFAQYQGRVGAQALQAGVRRDDNEQFGGHTSATLAWGMEIGTLRLHAAAGSAFKAPSFNELYYPYYGNPALRPETSRSLEAGIAGSHAGWRWSLQAYRTQVDDLIVWDAALFIANNIERARIRGAEFTLAGDIGGWSLSTQLGVVDARNHSHDPNHGKRLARRAPRSARIELDRNFRHWSFGATAIAEGARWDDAGNLLRVPGYGTLDLRIGRAVSANWRLQATLGNVFDKAYETAAFYRQPGREWGLSLRYAPAD